jgi:hypothetical protein
MNPLRRTVRIIGGSCGPSILRRSRPICTSTRLVFGTNLYFHTSRRSISRVSTRPSRRIIYSSRRNSRGSKAMERSPRLAVRSMRSSSSGPTCSFVSGVSTARCTRASINALRSKLPWRRCASVKLLRLSPAISEDALNTRGGEGFNHLICNRACHDLLLS